MADKPTTDFVEATSPERSKVQILTDVHSLAHEFSTCVEAFNLIHPSKDNDHAQKVALTKLGLQQGRLLIFGDAVGISAPPATIARHMIPSHPGITNPDPHLPVNFGLRDPRLDEESVNARIRKALHEIAGRPSTMSRDQLMSVYGMKSPKTFNKLEYPALDTNRLEAFREKYALLNDLVRSSGARTAMHKRNLSMTTSHWTVKDSTRFNQFVKTVRTEVDALIELMGVKEHVDRGTRSDIRCLAWHPDLSGPIVRQDWTKLKLIREACEVDYPEYIEVVDMALQYINAELKETSLAKRRANLGLTDPPDGAAGGRRKSDYDIRSLPPAAVKAAEKTAEKSHLQVSAEKALNPNSGKERRPSWMSAFKLKSFSKSAKHEKGRSKSHPGHDEVADPPRSMSAGEGIAPDQSTSDETNGLEPVRSKSLSAIPDAPALDLDSRMRGLSIASDTKSDPPAVYEDGRIIKDFGNVDYGDRLSLDTNTLRHTSTTSSEGSPTGLYNVTTVNSLIDRHDMYQGMGRIQTNEIRELAHEIDRTG